MLVMTSDVLLLLLLLLLVVVLVHSTEGAAVDDLVASVMVRVGTLTSVTNSVWLSDDDNDVVSIKHKTQRRKPSLEVAPTDAATFFLPWS